jgi:hypothetical protein
MQAISIEVTYAAQMKPGDLYAGKVNPAAPTTPVQTFAAAHRLTDVTPHAGADGRRMLHLRAGALILEPVLAAAQVLVVRERQPAPERGLASQHGEAPDREMPDPAALDRIAEMLRDPFWSAGMLEDIADLIRQTGRATDNYPDHRPTWDRH